MDVPLAVDEHDQRLLRVVVEPEPDVQPTDCPLALVVVTRAGRVLVGRNRWREEWELPGGLVEDGETLRVAAARELEEEARLAVAPDNLVWLGFAVFDLHGPDRRERAGVYAAIVDETAVVAPSEELVEVAWCDLDDPPANTSPLDFAIARWACDHG